MKKNIFQRRIPTLLALFILMAGLAVTSLLIQQGVFYVGKASPQEEPQNIQITNITQNSFTVAFTTTEPTTAGVSIVNSDPPEVFFDIRNLEGSKSYSSHFITIDNLKPNTSYEFNIISNGTVYLNDGKNFETKTAEGENIKENPFIFSGKVLLPDGSDGSDVLVNAVIPEAAPVTAVTDQKGNFSIPANLIRDRLHQKLLKLDPGLEITLTATNGKLKSDIRFSYVPGIEIPTITLSENYSFIAQQEQESQISTPSSELSIPTGPKPPDVKITTPKNDQTFTDTKPRFAGTAFANRIVKINIGPDNEISAQVRSASNGDWSYRSAVALSTGEHTITVTSTDSFGMTRTASRSFIILPLGSQIAQAATPSATPTSLPSPTPTGITPSPTLVVASPTPSPTIPIPTPTPTMVVLQLTPTPTAFIGGPHTEIPPTGPEFLPIMLTSISLLFIVAGSALLFIL